MNTGRLPRIPLLLHLALAFVGGQTGAEEAQARSAAELAAQLSALRQDGSTEIRARLAMPGSNLQLQIKSRRTAAGSDVYYRILWPKERNAEAFVIRQRTNGAASGAVRTLESAVQPITQVDLKKAVFGSDLSYEDLVDNFYAWSSQVIAGTENINGTVCTILESKPAGVKSSYSAVRSWIDLRRMVPLRVEKYAGGAWVRRIDTERIVTNDGRQLAASLRIHRPGQSGFTELDGSKIRRGVTLTDADFSNESVQSP